MRVWNFIAAPSPLITSPADRRQAQLMARVLVVITPTFVLLSAVSALTSAQKMGWTDLFLFLGMLAGTLGAYFLNRTQNYLRGTVLLSWLGVVAAALVPGASKT